MKQKAYSRDERKQQIVDCLASDIRGGGDGQLTASQIAKVLGVTASSKLRKILAELQSTNELISYTEAIPGLCKFRRVYALHPDNLWYLPANKIRTPRTMLLRTRGKAEEIEI